MIDLGNSTEAHAGGFSLRPKLLNYTTAKTGAPQTKDGFVPASMQRIREATSGPDRTHADQRIEACINHMMQHLNKPIKVRSLSILAGLSESTFFALFKRATGRTPLDFFIRARMGLAGELLTGTTLQIKEVAARLGYDDQFYFSRQFKSVHRISPREYRVQKRESNSRDPKPNLACEKTTTSFIPPCSARADSDLEIQANERSQTGGLQPVIHRTHAQFESRNKFPVQPDQNYSVSVHP